SCPPRPAWSGGRTHQGVRVMSSLTASRLKGYPIDPVGGACSANAKVQLSARIVLAKREVERVAIPAREHLERVVDVALARAIVYDHLHGVRHIGLGPERQRVGLVAHQRQIVLLQADLIVLRGGRGDGDGGT